MHLGLKASSYTVFPKNYLRYFIKGSVMVIQVFLFFCQGKLNLRHPGTNPGELTKIRTLSASYTEYTFVNEFEELSSVYSLMV
jgi:hypothetical protein